MFQSFYDSPVQHPWALLVVPALFLWHLRKEVGPFARVWRVFVLLTMADALFTGPLVQVLNMSSGVAQAVAIFFVILGDLRWFFFHEFFNSTPARSVAFLPRSLVVAAGLSLIVPIAQALLVRCLPDLFTSGRRVFLAYELLFFSLVLLAFLPKLPGNHGAIRTFKRDLCLYALTYYGLWALADVIILNEMDAGFLLRVIPNQMYYAFFLPFIWSRARKLGLLSDSKLGATPNQT
jgi:hypothetical protein